MGGITDADIVREEYFRWLCDKVSINEWYGHSYYGLANILYECEFHVVVSRDSNRESNAYKMRQEWIDSYNRAQKVRNSSASTVANDIINGPISVLEIMVSMASELEDRVLQDDRMGNRTAQWFWIMVDNLGIRYSDDGSVTDETIDDIRTKVENAVDRNYARNGVGGFWPVLHSMADQTKVELWYQMAGFISENIG